MLLYNHAELVQVLAQTKSVIKVKFAFLGKSQVSCDMGRFQGKYINLFLVTGNHLYFLLLFLLKNIFDCPHLPPISYSYIDLATNLQLSFIKRPFFISF